MTTHGRNRDMTALAFENVSFPADALHYGDTAKVHVTGMPAHGGQPWHVEVKTYGGGWIDKVEDNVATYDFVMGASTAEVANEWVGEHSGIVYGLNPKGRALNLVLYHQFTVLGR